MIDEKKLIEELEKLKQEVNMPVDIVWNNLLKVCIDTVNEQPKVGEWIPCSERLPEVDGVYLCTMKGELCGEEEPFTGMCGFEKGEWDEPDCVVAWMPLPEPYHPRKE